MIKEKSPSFHFIGAEFSHICGLMFFFCLKCIYSSTLWTDIIRSQSCHSIFSFQYPDAIIIIAFFFFFCILGGCCLTCKTIYNEENEENFLYQFGQPDRPSGGSGYFIFLYYLRYNIELYIGNLKYIISNYPYN